MPRSVHPVRPRWRCFEVACRESRRQMDEGQRPRISTGRGSARVSLSVGLLLVKSYALGIDPSATAPGTGARGVRPANPERPTNQRSAGATSCTSSQGSGSVSLRPDSERAAHPVAGTSLPSHLPPRCRPHRALPSTDKARAAPAASSRFFPRRSPW